MLQNVAIVLVRPKRAENVGAAVRAAVNMGIGEIWLVGDELPDKATMLRVATHHAGHLVEKMKLSPSLATCLAPFSWVVGTSARKGRQRHSLARPRRMVTEILPKMAHNRVALVFGPEDSGLTNDDLRLCNMVTSIPTADFSSLNLAQAVAIISYELFYGVVESRSAEIKPTAKLACSEELEWMYGHIEEALKSMGHLKETDYPYWMHNIRHFFGRIGVRAREAKFIRGFCSQLISITGEKKK
ncbi:MAG: TrmJ/YjtD family RNA methyltransferase [Desulfobulbaceae bacterium]|nr:TrmJ/YjtD family RNA methyltransferase [Desulfobulbaceae bacterium]